jgi:hypothetical protein
MLRAPQFPQGRLPLLQVVCPRVETVSVPDPSRWTKTHHLRVFARKQLNVGAEQTKNTTGAFKLLRTHQSWHKAAMTMP